MEKWYIKENGGEGDLVGIASTASNWFIAEEVLPKNAKIIVENFNTIQYLKAEISAIANALLIPLMSGLDDKNVRFVHEQLNQLSGELSYIGEGKKC